MMARTRDQPQSLSILSLAAAPFNFQRAMTDQLDSSRWTTEGAATPAPVHGHRPAATQNTSTHNRPPRRLVSRPQTFDRQTGDMPDFPVPQISLPHRNSSTVPPPASVATTASIAQPDGVLTPSTAALPHPLGSTDHPGRELAIPGPGPRPTHRSPPFQPASHRLDRPAGATPVAGLLHTVPRATLSHSHRCTPK
jgi:hypothetical protein